MKIGTFDLESDGLLDQATRVWCAVLKDSNTKEVFKFRPHQIPEFIKLMDSYDVLKAHNGIGFDWPLLEKLYGYKYKGKKVDTLLMSRLLNPKRQVPPNCPNKTSPHGVEAWGYRVGRGKPEHNDWSQFSEDMLHRCTEDVEIQEMIYDKLIEESKGGNWRSAFLLTFELFENLQKQEEYGWAVDRPHMERCIKILDRYIRRIDANVLPKLPNILEVEETKKEGIYNYVRKPFLKSGAYAQSVVEWSARCGISLSSQPVGGCFSRINYRQVDINSGDEIKDYLLSQGWEPLEWNTNDNRERTSPKLSKDDPFEGVDGPVGRLVAKRVQAKQRRSIIEGLLGIVRVDGRIAARITGLADSFRGKHAGVVNIPKASSFFGKQMRQIFTSKPGFVLVGTDSAGNQLRQLAARMNNPEFIYAMTSGKKEDGTDPHTLTQKAGELESRDIAKNTMYCLLFGGGDAKLARTAKKPAGTGADLRKKLYQGLDGLGPLMERLTTEWRNSAKQRYNPEYRKMEYYNGCITGLDGRPVKVPYEHQLLVYLLQSDEAIQLSKAYNLVFKKLEAKWKWGVDWGIVGWLHDEIQIECREDIAEEVGQLCCDAIREAGEFYNITCPHAGEYAIGKNWYLTH